MKILILSFLLLCSQQMLFAQKDRDYGIYHRLINTAEEQMFLRNRYDSAKKLYREAFTRFEFCFARDCLIAAQLAAFHHDYPSCIYFLDKSFSSGVKITDLYHLWGLTQMGRYHVTIFDSFLYNKKHLNTLNKLYRASHKKYVDRVDKELKVLMSSIFIHDQLSKNNRHGRTGPSSEYNFIESRFDSLYNSIYKNIGFPGEKLIGIDDSDAMAQLGMPDMDLLSIYDKSYRQDSAKYHVRRSQFRINRDFSVHTVIVPMLHNSCAYRNLLPYLDSQIHLGNIHPRDAAYILDFAIDGQPRNITCAYPGFKPYYVGRKVLYGEMERDISVVNVQRQRIYIPQVEQDMAKAKYARDNKLMLFFGFFFYL